MEGTPPEENSQATPMGPSFRGPNPYVLPASILIAAIIIGGSMIYMVNGRTGSSPAAVVLENPVVPAVAQVNESDAVRGDSNAPVLIVEYGDYQCPFCGRYFSEVEPLIDERYVNTGKARFAFRHLAFLGPESVAAAQATECAKEQGKFWEYHAALYIEEIADGQEHNGNLNRELFLKLAQQVGLDAGVFASCVDSEKYAARVQEANSAAAAAGVYSTPTTFVNGRKVVLLDADGNPVPDARTGTTQSVGASIQPIISAIEAAL